MLLDSATDTMETVMKFLAAVTALAGAIAGAATAIAAFRRRSNGSGDEPPVTVSGHPPVKPPDRSTSEVVPRHAATDVAVHVGAGGAVDVGGVAAERARQGWVGRPIPPSPKVGVAQHRRADDRWYTRESTVDPNLWTGDADAATPPRVPVKPRPSSARWWARSAGSDLVGLGGGRHGTD